MRGHFERRSWEYDPDLYAPARYRRACAYDSFVPDPLADLSIQLPGGTAGVVSDAEAAISELNRSTERGSHRSPDYSYAPSPSPPRRSKGSRSTLEAWPGPKPRLTPGRTCRHRIGGAGQHRRHATRR